MLEKKFITTTLPYANSVPHIGHAFEFIIADCIARYYRNKLGKENVLFNVGLDEHGKKIFDASIKEGMTPLNFLDNLDIKWREFCQKLDISFDNFYRTSDYPHYSRVQQFWVKLKKKGLIYEKEYSGKYCNGCESFKTDKDLENGICLDHPNVDITEVSEKNFFFKLSYFKDELREIYKTNPYIFSPINKLNEIYHLIDDIQDISISRNKESVSWGIPVPGSENQVVYVWFDALLNYIFSAGYYSDDSEFDEYWEGSIQVFGPDNIRFQSVIFQGLLCAAEIYNTDKLICHGTILDEHGKKMSKSLGNVVDPIDQVNKYGLDAIKYYSLAGINIYSNSSWDENEIVNIYNSHLADDYGNLISRVVTLMSRGIKDNELVCDANIIFDNTLIHSSTMSVLIREQISEIKDLWDNYRISEALNEMNRLIKWCNKYINDKQPWRKQWDWWFILLELHYFLELITELYIPIFPEKVNLAKKSLMNLEKIVLFEKINSVEKIFIKKN